MGGNHKAMNCVIGIYRDGRDLCFQSPIHRGSKCNIRITLNHWYARMTFQSPIHRGSKCNLNCGDCLDSVGAFQSPIHRGSKCNKFR